MSDDEDRPPTEQLRPLSNAPNPTSVGLSSSVLMPGSMSDRKPYQIKFASRDEEVRYLKELHANCHTYDGNSDDLLTWLDATNSYLTTAVYPEMDHPFIMRHLLTGDALNYYLAHEDLILNFCDLRKLFLHKQNALAPLRALSTLASVPTKGEKADFGILQSEKSVENL